MDQFCEDQVDEDFASMKHECWCKDREFDAVQKRLRHSDVLMGALAETKNLSRFDRVLSEGTCKTLIFNVIIKPRSRSHGEATGHPILSLSGLSHVKSFEPGYPERLTGLYQQPGFPLSESKLRHTKQAS